MTQAHVAVCARCQARLAKLTGASRLLADNIRGTGLPRWSAPTPQEVISAARAALVWWLALTVLAALTLVTAAHVMTVNRRAAAGQHSPLRLQPADGCRPDLPNDKCR